MDQPATDAGAAVSMFTGCLEGALQYVSTHTAQKALIHIANKPLQIIAHSATTVIYYKTCQREGKKKIQCCYVLAHFLIFPFFKSTLVIIFPECLSADFHSTTIMAKRIHNNYMIMISVLNLKNNQMKMMKTNCT